MKKLALAIALGAILALLVWLFRTGDPAIGARTTPAIATSPRESTTEFPVLAAADDARAEPREVVRAADTHADGTAVPPSAPATEPALAPPRAFDATARDWIHIIVQDRHGAPIANAEIHMTGMRTPRDPGSSWGWSDEPSIGRTGADGTAKLWYPVWIDADHPTGGVSLIVQHPDYFSHEEHNFTIGPTPRVIVLEQGAFVVVSGWFESKSEVVRDVVPHMTWGAKIQDSNWLPIKDGRLSCASVPPGRHGIYLSHTSAEHGACFSAPEFFEVTAGQQIELHLQLLPGRRFEGLIDRAVPRPIVNGAVKLNLQVGERSSSEATMLRVYDAQVSAEGTFAFTDLPPGDGQIIAICDGWVSQGVPAGPEYLAESDLSPEDTRRQLENIGPVAQSVRASMDDAPFELRMEPAATVHATIVDPDGKPVAGALLSLWPNVHWRTGYASLFMERVFDGRSDERGQVTISNLPSGHVYAGVQHAHYAVREDEQARRHLEFDLEAGKTSEARIELVTKKDE